MCRIIDTGEYSYRMYKWAAGRSEVKTKHFALYGYLLTCVREFKKDRFAVKTEFAMLSAAMKFKKAYRETLSDLEKWGFIRILSRGKNQFVLTEVMILDFDPDRELNETAEDVEIPHAVDEIDTVPDKPDGTGKPGPNNDPSRNTTKVQKGESVLYGEYVRLNPKDYEGMVSQYGEKFTNRCIEKLDSFCANGKKYKNYMAAMKNWVITTIEKEFKDGNNGGRRHTGWEKPGDGGGIEGVRRAVQPDHTEESEYPSTIPVGRTNRGG